MCIRDRALVGAGAHLDAVTCTWRTDRVFGANSGQTALHWAADAGHAHVVCYLLEAGCQVSAEDERGKMPEHATMYVDIKKALADARERERYVCCLLYTSDAADEEDSVDLGGGGVREERKRRG
eukprot:TRINITY_DN23820_c0_g1_i1.p1 TRINITY_DN23820_c0_g1~~TRINITY_DN23820_c0_g1_i1.p1  ORF type:complete len:124 (-),score=30.56 TRINITY_DN23820_c0_g1_i1:6-377(-)